MKCLGKCGQELAPAGHLARKPRKPRKGDIVAVPCQVKDGPFPDERRIYLKTGYGDEWFGIVTTDKLYNKGATARDLVACRLESLKPYTVRPLGSSPASHPVRIYVAF